MREEHARQRALQAEERRLQREAQRPARAQPTVVAADEPTVPTAVPAGDPPTRPSSLTDELFGIGDDDERAGRQHPAAAPRPRPARRPVSRPPGAGVWADLVGQEPTVAVLHARRGRRRGHPARRGRAPA